MMKLLLFRKKEKVGVRRSLLHGAAAILLCTLFTGPLSAANSYLVHNLVSDLPNVADRTDKNLVNPWGIGFSATSPFWLGNNHSGTSTIYDGSGAPLSLVVNIPSADAGNESGAVTGVVFNGTQAFAVAPGKPASFLFCSEDGTISGWNSSVDPTHAKTLTDNPASNAVYKGCTIAGPSSAPLLYATNFRAGRIDIWRGDLKPVQNVGAFQDPAVPSGFAPFNIQNLNGKLYVAYAKQDSDKTDDVPGNGNGYVAVFDTAGVLLQHLISQGPLNSPWGLAIAPATFGDFANALLVGNFGDGTIHAFDANTGALLGALNDTTGKPVAIAGLWALVFGNGEKGGDPATLYFTAGIPGPDGDALETHGLFGSIQPPPSFQLSGVVNSASFSGKLAANAWATIKGGALSATTRGWQDKDFVNGQLPTQLDGVSVTMNGEPAYVGYVSPGQINLLIPADLPPGPVQIQTSNNGLTSAALSVTLQPAAPAFFQFGGTKYIAATHSDGSSLAGPPDLIPGVTTTPVKPGETVVLYANGLGATTPPIADGRQIPGTPLPTATLPGVKIGGLSAQVVFAGLTAPGLYQINLVVPDVPSGGATLVNAEVVASVGGMSSQPDALLSVAPAPAAKNATVDISNFAFAPDAVTVPKGAAVVWTNRDGTQHTVTADDNQFKSKNLNNGDTFSQTWDTPGTHSYHCSIHPFMKGKVVVQ